jgi:hypothetical protein
MIIICLMGGLGNQLFQYAAGRRLADRIGTTLKIDLSMLHRNGQRPYGLDRFNIRASLTRYLSLDFYEGCPKGNIRRWIIRRYGEIVHRLYSRIPEPSDMSLSEEVLQTRNRRVVLYGFWQSERYFMDDRDAIRRDMTLKDPPVGKNKDLVDLMAQVNAVSLHVRRGDYACNPVVNAVHGTCSLEYYQKAVARIAARVTAPHFFVFSDDPEWTRNHLRIPYPSTWVSHNGPEHDFEDLRLMRHCRHHIIANSSFSWWGAWLAERPDQMVVAPAQWFAVTRLKTGNLLPSSWIRL